MEPLKNLSRNAQIVWSSVCKKKEAVNSRDLDVMIETPLHGDDLTEALDELCAAGYFTKKEKRGQRKAFCVLSAQAWAALN